MVKGFYIKKANCARCGKTYETKVYDNGMKPYHWCMCCFKLYDYIMSNKDEKERVAFCLDKKEEPCFIDSDEE